LFDIEYLHYLLDNFFPTKKVLLISSKMHA